MIRLTVLIHAERTVDDRRCIGGHRLWIKVVSRRINERTVGRIASQVERGRHRKAHSRRNQRQHVVKCRMAHHGSCVSARRVGHRCRIDLNSGGQVCEHVVDQGRGDVVAHSDARATSGRAAIDRVVDNPAVRDRCRHRCARVTTEADRRASDRGRPRVGNDVACDHDTRSETAFVDVPQIPRHARMRNVAALIAKARIDTDAEERRLPNDVIDDDELPLLARQVLIADEA